MMNEVNRRERRRSFFLLGHRERVGPLAQPGRGLLPSPQCRTMLEKLSSRDSQSGLSNHFGHFCSPNIDGSACSEYEFSGKMASCL
jgi:hypothetical protein